ncbi:1626_t:CDS:1 [Funneliformis geosporum]|uniref:1626_t:CDS:1 n=1 Tax=Funneliformis geosporum TaxID=1117311 RepID=A0A9W4SXX3_9GLOM|nr:1626_t:CDS:1 [Funneliformis geosporum]
MMIYTAMQDILSDEFKLDEIDEEDDIKIDEEDIVDTENDSQFDFKNNEIQIENFINLRDKELAKLLKTQEIRVVIEPIIIDYDKKEFDLNSLLDQNLGN